MLLELIEAEAVERTGAGRYERVEGRGIALGTTPRHFGQDWRLAARHPRSRPKVCVPKHSRIKPFCLNGTGA